MKVIADLVRMMVVATIVMIGAGSPAAACTGMVPGTEMAAAMVMTAAAPDEPAPTAAPRCDMACLACLVQPAAVRLPVAAGWTTTIATAAAAHRLLGLAAPPELPPPRFRPAPFVKFL